jgi:hypothetical protein
MRSSQIHRNKPLENLSVAYTPVGLIADVLAPKSMVQHESDTFYVYAKDTLSLPETVRADGAESNQATFNVTTSSYQLVEHALHDDVTDRQRKNADTAIKPELDVTEDLTRKILLRREVDLMNLIQTPGNWGNLTSLTSTLAWSANTTLSNPITLLDSVASSILQQSGRVPNVLALADASFRAAKEHVSVLDRIKYTSPDSVTPDLLARLFNLQKVVVSQAIRNTADEGLTETTTAQAFIMTDTAFLAYIEPTPKLKMVTALTAFWSNEGGSPYIVKKWREEKLSADRIEASVMFQHRAICSDAAALIINTNQ